VPPAIIVRSWLSARRTDPGKPIAPLAILAWSSIASGTSKAGVPTLPILRDEALGSCYSFAADAITR
jgi:hypothetical protein